MQEQAAATLAELAYGDKDMQDTIIHSSGVPPLLSLVRSGSPTAQEHAARAMWFLSMQMVNQTVVVENGAIPDLVALARTGSPKAAMLAAASLSELAKGYIQETYGVDTANGLSNEVPDKQPPPGTEPADTSATDTTQSRLQAIADANGIVPLIRLCGSGSMEAKEKASSALWHLALDHRNRTFIGVNGGISPLATVLATAATAEAQQSAFYALVRLAKDNVENQPMIAKALIGMLDSDDADVEKRAVSALLSIANENPEDAPTSIMRNTSAGAPLVLVLTSGKSEESRTDAVKLLHALASSSSEHHASITNALAELLGVGSPQAQENVTELLLTLSPSGEEGLVSRQSIAKTSPFRRLIRELIGPSPKVRMLAAAVLSRLVGDSLANKESVAAAKGIKPLVALLDAKDNEPETQEHAAVVLAEMAAASSTYANSIASEGAIPLCVKLLESGSAKAKAPAAVVIRSLASGFAAEVRLDRGGGRRHAVGAPHRVARRIASLDCCRAHAAARWLPPCHLPPAAHPCSVCVPRRWRPLGRCST